MTKLVCVDIADGLLVERFLGGNFNNTTGDFSADTRDGSSKWRTGGAFSEANMSVKLKILASLEMGG